MNVAYSKVNKARESGYSDDQIIDFLSSRKDLGSKIKKAKEYGYSSSDILNHISPPQKISPISGMKRELSRTGARIGEAFLGAPGNTFEFLLRGLNFAAKKVPGGKPKSEEEFEEISKSLPTSSNIRKFHEKYTGEYLKPQTPLQEKSDEFISDVTSLLTPLDLGVGKLRKGVKLASGGMQILKNIGKNVLTKSGLTLAAHGSEQVGKALDMSPENANYLKMGTLFLGSLMNKNGIKGAEKYKNSLYEESKSLRPNNATTSSKVLNQELNDLQKELLKGSPRDLSKQKAFNFISDTKSKIRNGKIKVEEIEEMKKSLNESRYGLYNEKELTKAGRALAKKHLDSIGSSLDRTLKQYGKTNKNWYKSYSSANEAHAAIAQSKRVSNFISRHFKLKTHGPAALVLEALSGHPGAILPTIAGGSVFAGALKASELGYRIFKSPVLTKYYSNVLLGALKEDANFMNHNLNRLNEEMEKEDAKK